jgi:hypothetical protein
MTIGTELRFAPPVAAMDAFIEPHRPWLESVLGCPLSESVTFELEVAFGQLVAEDLLGGVPLDRECLAGAETLRPAVSRWAIPPGLSPRITLQPGRNRQAPTIARDLAWDPHWKETPVALWFHGFQHAVAAINTPFVSFTAGGTDDWQPLLIVNRSELAPALKLLSGVLVESRKTVRVLGGHNVALPPNSYDWDRVVLDPTLIRLVRDDFENFLGREGWFKQHRLPFRRGYLFYGPPGNGKTSALRVMASHPAISAHSLDFSNEELENGALTTVFEEASRRAPSLVLFEDLDRLYGQAITRDNRTRITLQHLLNCLDGLAQHEGVIVVATANDPTALDPAILRRPGRFDRVVPFRPPAADLRREYLRRLSGGSFDEQTLTKAAHETDGCSFAQLREGYILAGQLAFGREGDEVRPEDLLEGIRMIRVEAQTVGSRLDGRGVGFGLCVSQTPAA